jgi:ubiquitin carboxyl-terminal hydrolase 7
MEEEMKGDNQYRAEKFGLQDAKKGCRFLKFPPILQLQLKRFEFDLHTGAMVKVNDKFEFPTTLDVTPYLSPSEPRDEKDPNIYYLHSVLVHSGSVHGGHYYTYIRPITPTGEVATQQWYKFDDESVYRVSEQYAVNGSFGGDFEHVSYQFGRKYTQQMTRFANAYMLIYIRKSECEALQKMHAE